MKLHHTGKVYDMMVRELERHREHVMDTTFFTLTRTEYYRLMDDRRVFSAYQPEHLFGPPGTAPESKEVKYRTFKIKPEARSYHGDYMKVERQGTFMGIDVYVLPREATDSEH